MVASNEDASGPFALDLNNPVDNLPGLGSAVDQVAEKDQTCFLARLRCIVQINFGKQLVKQVQPAMDIADNISPDASNAGRTDKRRGSGF